MRHMDYYTEDADWYGNVPEGWIIDEGTPRFDCTISTHNNRIDVFIQIGNSYGTVNIEKEIFARGGLGQSVTTLGEADPKVSKQDVLLIRECITKNTKECIK